MEVTEVQMRPAQRVGSRSAIIRSEQVGPFLGVGKTLFHQLRKRADFPRAVVLGGKARGYVVAELERWLESHAPRAE